MPRFARIENGEVRELVDFDPAGRFHPSLVWVEAPDGVEERYTFDGDDFSPPAPRSEPESDPDEEPLTPAERKALRAVLSDRART